MLAHNGSSEESLGGRHRRVSVGEQQLSEWNSLFVGALALHFTPQYDYNSRQMCLFPALGVALLVESFWKTWPFMCLNFSVSAVKKPLHQLAGGL